MRSLEGGLPVCTSMAMVLLVGST